MPGRLAAAFKNIGDIKIAVFMTGNAQIRSFLGARNAYGRYIKNFHKTALPLNDYFQKNKTLNWSYTTREALGALNMLKIMLVEFLLLDLSQAQKPHMINTNLTAYALG